MHFYVVHSGSVKTYVETASGEQQITGFHFPGALLGMDSIESEQHTYSVEALETSSICELKLPEFKQLTKTYPVLQQQLCKLMSHEIIHEQSMMLLLGKMSAERRLAYFLMDMSLSMQAHGLSANDFRLSMTRHDIANYLGLAIETVSRLLSYFQSMDMLDVARRNITILDRNILQSLIDNRSVKKVFEQIA